MLIDDGSLGKCHDSLDATDAHAHDPCDAKSGSLGGTRKVK